MQRLKQAGKLVTMMSLALMSGKLFAEVKKSSTLSFIQKERQLSESDRQMALDEQYLSVAEVRITPLGEEENERTLLENDKDLGEVVLAVDQLIATGKKIWALVEAGRPVVSQSFSSISVLPRVEDPALAFYGMENWSAPKSLRYKVEYSNFYGMNVISFVYSIHFQYDGTYHGHGRYLTSVNIVANTVEVAWGFEFDAKSTLVAITNRGTVKEPVAAATLQVFYRAKSILKDISSTSSYHVDGNGGIKQLD